MSLLFSFGTNSLGRTGLGLTTGTTNTPTQIGSDTDWDVFSAGTVHGLAIRDGKLYSWGNNGSGVTGLGTTSGTTNTPTQIGIFTDWTAVATGNNHSLAIRDGRLYSWGSNQQGRTGLGTTSGTTNTPTQVGTGTDWTAVAGGVNYSLALRSTGQLFGFGSNSSGQLGDGTTTQRTTPTQSGSFTDWTHISAAVHTATNLSLGIRNGELYSWGPNGASGQTGLGLTSGNTVVPTRVGTDSDWTAISSGNSYGLGVRDGKLFAWGSNANGKTGLGTTTGSNTVPVQVGTDTGWTDVAAAAAHSLAVKQGELYSCGDNTLGRTGLGLTTGDTTTFTQVGTDSDWSKVSAGGSYSLASKTTGTTPGPITISATAGFGDFEATYDVTSDGGQPITAKGILYSTVSTEPQLGEPDVTSSDDGPGTGGTTDTYGPVTPGDTVYVRAYAVNSVGIGYSDTVEVVILFPGDVPGPITLTATPGFTNFQATYNVTEDGGQSVTAKGILFSTVSFSPELGEPDVTSSDDGPGTGGTTAFYGTFTPGQTVYVRAYAVNVIGIGYSDTVAVTTKSPPTVTTGFPSNVSFFSARLGGTVSYDGPEPIAARGVVLATTAPNFFAPVAGQRNIVMGEGTGTFSQVVSSLDPGQEYFFRAYGSIDSVLTSQGDVVSFSTLEPEAPSAPNLTMPDAAEDTQSVGVAGFVSDPMNIGSYTWQVSAQTSAPFIGGSSAVITVGALTAGTVSIISQNNSLKTAQVRFLPEPDWFGTAQFSIRVGNGFEFSTWVNVSVNITPVVDAPSAVIGDLPSFNEDTPTDFDLTWTDPDDIPPGSLVADPNYFIQMRPVAGGAWRWLTSGSPTASLVNVAVRILSYSTSELRATMRVEPEGNFNGFYGAQVRVAKQVGENQFLFGPSRTLSAEIFSVPDAPTRPQPNRMPTGRVGQIIVGTFTTFDPDLENTFWTFQISAPDANDWGSTLVTSDIGTFTVVDDDLTDQQAQVRLVQEEGGASELRYEFDLRVLDSSGLISPVQRVRGFITPPGASVFLQKVTRSSPAVIVPLTILAEVVDLNLVDSIDGIGGASVTVSTDELRRRASQLSISVAELLEPGTVELVVAIGGDRVFTGPVGDVEWNATSDTIDISARGLLSYLEERRIGTGTTSFVGEDISDIMWTLVDDAQDQSFGDYAITDSTAASGTSITVEFERRTRILEALRNLSAADGAPEVFITPDRELTTAPARGQDRRNIIRLTPGMISAATWTNRDEQIFTVVTVVGGEDGLGGFFEGSAVTADSAALARFGRREKLLDRRELTSNQDCEDYARRIVEQQARRSETIRIDMVITPGQPFSIRDINVGDIITVDLRAPDLGQVIGAYRIVNRRLNLVSETADSYRIRIDLVPAPFTETGQLVQVKARHNASIIERLAQIDGQQQ